MISHCCIFGYPICGQINIPKCHLGLFSYDSWDVGKRVWPKRPTPLQEHTALQTKWKNVEAGTDWIIQTYGVFLKMVDLQNYGLHMASLLKWCNMCNFGWADSPYIDHPCDFHGVYPLKLHPRCRVESSWICSTLLVCASGKSISVARTGALSLEKTPEQYADSLSNMRGSTGSIHRNVIFNWWELMSIYFLLADESTNKAGGSLILRWRWEWWRADPTSCDWTSNWTTSEETWSEPSEPT
jgi:hypothetical protein